MNFEDGVVLVAHVVGLNGLVELDEHSVVDIAEVVLLQAGDDFAVATGSGLVNANGEVSWWSNWKSSYPRALKPY